MQVFYCEDLPHQNVLLLSEEESRHVKVLRKEVNDVIYVTDGKGNLYEARIVGLGKKTELQIIGKEYQVPGSFKLHLAVSPTKNMDRLEWMIEKCTELGVDEFSFIECRYSERKKLKTDRLKRKALSAIKQSKQLHLPIINELVSLDLFMDQLGEYSHRFVAHCNENGERKKLSQLPDQGAAVILIGPEGDFSDDEIKKAIGNGFRQVVLGDTILRTETAAMASATLVRYLSDSPI